MADDDTTNLTVTTDASDYQPGVTAQFTVDGVAAGDAVTFTVTHVDAGADGILGTADDVVLDDITGTGTPWTVTDGGAGDLDGVVNGSVTTSWYVNPDALGQGFVLTATDVNSGASATTTFTDNTHTPVNAIPISEPNGLVFLTGDQNTSTGTGIFPSFVTIQNTGTEEGFNTDYRPAVEDTGASPVHNHSITFSTVPTVTGDGTNGTVNGTVYREFRLDLNETNPAITLDQLIVYKGATGNASSLAGLTELFNMDGGADGKSATAGDNVDVSVLLTAWSSGSGHSDYKILIPDSYFAGTNGSDFIYLYSQFSNSESGFEEWSVGPTVPVNPATPAIHIDKVTSDTNGLTTVTGDGITVLAGDTVTWTYTVTNPDTAPITITSITDDNGTPGDLGDDIHPTYVSGDSNSNGKVDPGESWIYTATGTAVVGDYTNNVVIHGTSNGTDDVTDHTDSSYRGADPEIAIAKVTNDAATSGDGLTINAGENISWTYTVTNKGNVGLSNVVVTDSVSGVNPTYVSGDTNNDHILDTDETWIYTASGIVGDPAYTAVIGPYSNTGYASGSFTDDAGHVGTANAHDDSNYVGADPEITIDKKTNGLQNGGAVLVGQTVTWTYDVTNSGNVPLTLDQIFHNGDTFAVTDDNGTPGNAADDFHPTYVNGDDGNGVLDVGETWHFTYSGIAVAGPYTNKVTVTGGFSDDAGHPNNPTATDTSGYVGVPQSLAGLTKGYWSTHLTLWDIVTGDEKGSGSELNVQPGYNWNHTGAITQSTLTTTGSASSLGLVKGANNGGGDSGLLLGDLDHNGLANDTQDLFFDLASAQLIANTSTSGDARLILASQAIAAQLNEYNDYVYDQAHGGVAAGFTASPQGLLEDAVLWLKGDTSFALSANGHSNINFSTSNDLASPSVVAIIDLGAASTNDYKISGNSLTLSSTSMSSSDASWSHLVSTGFTYMSHVLPGPPTSHTVYADGEGLKNALAAYNHGLDGSTAGFVMSADGSLIGWQDSLGGPVYDVQANTAGAFWGILEDQNLLGHTIAGISDHL